MLMVDKTMQQEAPAALQEQAPALTKEEIAQRVYLAVKLSEETMKPSGVIQNRSNLTASSLLYYKT